MLIKKYKKTIFFIIYWNFTQSFADQYLGSRIWCFFDPYMGKRKIQITYPESRMNILDIIFENLVTVFVYKYLNSLM
jgi:hypothetical protein